jgi:hypothetical protein
MIGNTTMAKTETPNEVESLLAATHDEESRVRYRSDRAGTAVSARGFALPATRPQRLARALRFAELLLETLPQSDPTRGLLELAIKRRDEVLLEGVLKELYEKQQAARTSPQCGSRR